MALRFDPGLGTAQLITGATARVVDTKLRFGELIDLGARSEQFLCKEIQKILQQSPRGELAEYLRDSYPTPLKRFSDADVVPATIAFISRLGVALKERPLRPTDNVDLGSLASFQDGGAELAFVLAGAAARLGHLVPPPGARKKLLDRLEAHAHIDDLDLADEALYASIDGRVDPLNLRPVQSATAIPPGLERVTFDALPDLMTYGAFDLVREVRKVVKGGGSQLRTGLMSYPGYVKTDGWTGSLARLTQLLWRFRDPRDPNRINWAGFLGTYGEEGQAIVEKLAERVDQTPPMRPNYDQMSRLVDALSSMIRPEKARPLVDALVRNDRFIPKRLACVDEAKKMIPDGHFTGRGLVATQHLFPTLIPLLEAYVEKGMRPRDMHLMGTQYASNPLVVSYGRLMGVDIAAATSGPGATDTLEANRVTELAAFAGTIQMTGRIPPNGWVVVDDGGVLHGLISGARSEIPAEWAVASGVLEALRKLFADVPVCGIEQTTRGLTELEGVALPYQVVKVADAEGKGKEGRVIGWDLARSTVRELRQRGKWGLIKTANVVSGGTVGKWAARFLKSVGLGVSVIDSDANKRAALEEEFPVHASIADVAADNEYMLSCTGKRAVDGKNARGLKGLLASGSSAAIEFNAHLLALAGVGAETVNWARPINFASDGHEQLSAEAIGLTRALILLASAQADPNAAGGLVPLDDAHMKIVDFWQARGGDACSEPVDGFQLDLPRPDSFSKARIAHHDEWMSYFQSCGRAVWPQPSQTFYGKGMHLFETEKGIRIVDTTVGRSFKLPFTKMPRILVGGIEGDEARTAFYFEDEDGRKKVQRFKVTRKGVRAAAPIDLGTNLLSAAFKSSHRPVDAREDLAAWADAALGETSGAFQYLFADGDEVVALDGSLKSPRRAQMAAGGADLFAFLNDDTVLQITKDPAAVTARPLDPEGTAPPFSLPSDFSSIEGITQELDGVYGTVDPTMIGKDAHGRVLVWPLNSAAQPYALPEGAQFRGLERVAQDTPGMGLRVRFLPQGCEDELENEQAEALPTA